jgi:thiol-disulfide isomerase/thioredoxin
MCRRRLFAALPLALAAGWLPASAASQALRRPWPQDRPTPPLALQTQEGAAWDLAGARGKVVVINFWASWCEPCRTEMPSLDLLAERDKADGLVVVAVNHRETDAAVRRFLEQMPTWLPILRDRDGAASRAWGVRVFPTTVLVGRDGRARFSIIGEADWGGAAARAWIAPLLQQRA